jgi:hypothetical protein
MKKTFKNALLAFALIAAGTGAYATSISHTSNEEATYLWNGSGPNGEGTTTGDIPHAENFYGCSGAGPVCATGVNTSNPADIQQIRLN